MLGKFTTPSAPMHIEFPTDSTTAKVCEHKAKPHYILSAPELYRFHPHSMIGRLPENLWRQVRARIFERDNYSCVYCGATKVQMHCDHVLPLSHGGSNDDDNLATSCPRCNIKKGRRTPQEWRGEA